MTTVERSSTPTESTATTAGTATQDNAATVAGIYAAFARGDVPAILATLADDVRWEHWAGNWAQRADVPYLRPRTGRDGVAEFFGIVGTWTVRDFAVLDVLGHGRQVAAEIRVEFEHPDGGAFADEEMHLWTFDERGKVTRFRHYLDTAKHIAAAAGEDTRGS